MPAMRLDAGVLDHVLGVGGVAGQPAGKRKRIAEMGQNHLAEAFGRRPCRSTLTASSGRSDCRPADHRHRA